MAFCIVSGDIATDYVHEGHVLHAPNRRPILIDNTTVTSCNLIQQKTNFSCSVWRGILVFVVCAVFFGFTWPTFLLTIIASLKQRHWYMFQVTIQYYGSFIAVADEKSYKKFLTAITTTSAV